ncbi:MAG TPA: hypothetical protein DCL54_02365 [Alphaproteobacteria bacterium]|nr:hypothetical protein [Alphaproteobacteria bacterium]HAJ45410.1 hypothetical protein [Alphaproteobacteria bacterium]
MSGELINKKGFGAFGCRIRRLSERLDREVREIYQSHGHYFDPCWYPVVIALLDHGPLTASELSAQTGIGVSTISQIKARLHSEGLVTLETDPKDMRRQRLLLTPKCRQLAHDLQPLWQAITMATQALCAETTPEFLNNLETIEVALTRRRMAARVEALLSRRQ